MGPKKKAIVDGNTYTYEYIDSAKFADGHSIDGIDRYSFTKTNNEWSVKIKKLFKVNFPDQKMHLEWLAEGKCNQLIRKLLKLKSKKVLTNKTKLYYSFYTRY